MAPLGLVGQVVQDVVQRIVLVAGQAERADLRAGDELALAVQHHRDRQHAVERGVAALAQGVAVLRRQHAAVDIEAARRAPRR